MREQDLGWQEVNLGWGEAALLLYSAIELVRLHVPSVDFGPLSIVPMGNRSRVLVQRRRVFSALGGESGSDRDDDKDGRSLRDGALSLMTMCIVLAREIERVRPVQPLEASVKVTDDKIGNIPMRDLANGHARVWNSAIRTFIINLDWIVRSLP